VHNKKGFSLREPAFPVQKTRCKLPERNQVTRAPVPDKKPARLLHSANEVEKMKRKIRNLSTCVALALSLGSTIATAGSAETITLMQFSDLHGKMVPH
jgi:hypothetical protein